MFTLGTGSQGSGYTAGVEQDIFTLSHIQRLALLDVLSEVETGSIISVYLAVIVKRYSMRNEKYRFVGYECARGDGLWLTLYDWWKASGG
jgi:hypothetical protein